MPNIMAMLFSASGTLRSTLGGCRTVKVMLRCWKSSSRLRRRFLQQQQQQQQAQLDVTNTARYTSFIAISKPLAAS
jgi:hypothetical protein